MIKLLMLGSSHSACFKKLVLPEKVHLSIFANRGGGLFKNLRFEDIGDFAIQDTADPWDHEVFRMSGSGASQNIHSYTHLVLNVNFKLDLPMIFHGDRDRKTLENMILSASNALCCTILEDHFFHALSIQKTKKLLDTIVNLGFQNKNILVLPTPFSCAKFDYSSEISIDHPFRRSLGRKIEYILGQSQAIAKNNYDMSLVMPDIQMLEVGMFAKASYSVPDSVTTWKNYAGEKLSPKDRVHKNAKYAELMLSKILRSISM